jgi:small subunit ribosomal protein S8
MAKTSLRIKQQRPQKYPVRAYSRCNRCGRPRANKALHEHAEMPTSRLKEGIARILKEEGYISDFHVKKGESFDTLVIQLKYGRSRERIITDLKRVSKPGRRVYAGKDRLPRVLGGMGVAILSTSTGLVTARTAEEKGIGGEVVCFVW